jgi:hypothetical protein
MILVATHHIVRIHTILHTHTGDMIVFYGEHSQYSILDYGIPDKDACYDATKPIGQGRLRSQREDFIHGKGIRIKAASYRTKYVY